MEAFKSKKDNKYRYLYKITNNLTGQYYYGIHTTYNLHDNYMGSGAKIKKDLKIFGVNNFTKEYVQFFEDDESLKLAEKNIITPQMLNDPICYNVLSGGGGFPGDGIFSARNVITGEIKAIKCDENYDKNVWVHVIKGRKRVSKNINGTIVSKYIYEEYLQKYLAEGWRTGFSSHSLGKIKVNDGCVSKYINPSELQKYLDEGWVKGGLPTGCGGRVRIINSSKSSEKMVHPSELQKYLDEGWIRGSLHSGRIHIHRENKHKMIFPSELQKYLDEGWVKGSNDHSILGRIKIIKGGECIVIRPSELQKYLDEGWVKGSYGTTNGRIRIFNEKLNRCKFIHPSELQKYLDEGWVKGKKLTKSLTK